MLIINFKTYNVNNLELCKKLGKLKNVYCAPQTIYLSQAVKHCKTISQHADPHPPGKHTGSVSVEELKKIGVVGSFLNHSEKPIPIKTIQQTVETLEEHGLKSFVFAPNITKLRQIKKTKPNYIVYEPPSLIGTNKSVTTAKPLIIKKAVKEYEQLLVGAGIKTVEDVEKATNLGAKGVVVSSGIVLNKQPEQVAKKFAEKIR